MSCWLTFNNPPFYGTLHGFYLELIFGRSFTRDSAEKYRTRECGLIILTDDSFTKLPLASIPAAQRATVL
jgi:hypothetical protein